MSSFWFLFCIISGAKPAITLYLCSPWTDRQVHELETNPADSWLSNHVGLLAFPHGVTTLLPQLLCTRCFPRLHGSCPQVVHVSVPVTALAKRAPSFSHGSFLQLPCFLVRILFTVVLLMPKSVSHT